MLSIVTPTVGMPGAAIRTGCADFVLALDEIAPALVKMVAVGEES